VRTRLSVTGKAAQFGKSVMEDISRKLLEQFVDCLESRLADQRGPEPAPAAGPGPAAGPPSPDTSPETGIPGQARSAPEPRTGAPTPPPTPPPWAQETGTEAIDLFGVARGALFKRLAPLAAAAALAALGLAVWLRLRGRPARPRGGCRGARHA
jgi:hypothetical protein